MKAKSNSRGASKKQPCTGCGDKGINNYMKGKPAANAAFMKVGRDQKPAKNLKRR
jgi:hypothetical protein